MRWKIYFWFILLLSVIIIGDGITEILRWKIYNWIDLLGTLFPLFGLFCFVFRKKVFSLIFWKIILWASIGSYIFTNLIYPLVLPPELRQALSFRTIHDYPLVEIVVVLIIFTLLYIPTYYAIYLLGYKGKIRELEAKEIKASENNTELKKGSIIGLILLTVITLGLYIPFWYLKQLKGINHLHSPEKLSKNTFVVILILSVATLAASFSPVVLKVLGYRSTAEDVEMIVKLINLIPGFMLLFQIFKVRRIFIDHFNDYLKKDIWVSGLLAFLFHIFYFQYLINKEKK